MPPRRSCFGPLEQRHRPGDRISMPPRRSRFEGHRFSTLVTLSHFNATTAFLLRPSSPWECFWRALISMPPRRSCFGGRSRRQQPPGSRFQCHHGVPASKGKDRKNARNPTHFNATTAFLLPFSSQSGTLSIFKISMPPRRSCFDEVLRHRAGVVAHFNATTAFLLPRRRRRRRARDLVSMPPRRSCFPQGGGRVGHHPWFQCHHGVPASGLAALGPVIEQLFQCHHGVPAS